MLLLAGPNMGGKSTLLRQACVITVMAQVRIYMRGCVRVSAYVCICVRACVRVRACLAAPRMHCILDVGVCVVRFVLATWQRINVRFVHVHM